MRPRDEDFVAGLGVGFGVAVFMAFLAITGLQAFNSDAKHQAEHACIEKDQPQ